jgi:hypothetical protein
MLQTCCVAHISLTLCIAAAFQAKAPIRCFDHLSFSASVQWFGSNSQENINGLVSAPRVLQNKKFCGRHISNCSPS